LVLAWVPVVVAGEPLALRQTLPAPSRQAVVAATGPTSAGLVAVALAAVAPTKAPAQEAGPRQPVQAALLAEAGSDLPLRAVAAALAALAALVAQAMQAGDPVVLRSARLRQRRAEASLVETAGEATNPI